MLRKQIVIGLLLVITIGTVLWGVWHLTRVPLFTIETVTAEGGITIQPSVVEAAVRDELEGTYYRLIPKRFAYLYPKKSIIERLQSIPRMQEVRVSREHQSLEILYVEYEPFALWCAEGDSSCVFIDRTGYGFAAAPPLRGSAFVRYLRAGAQPTVGEVAVSPALLRTTTTFIDTAATTFGFRPRTVWFDDRDVIYRLGGGGEIRTSQEDGVERVLTNTETILESSEFSHLEPGNFEYIDLRYGNKVFVQEELPEVATSTATNSDSTVEAVE